MIYLVFDTYKRRAEVETLKRTWNLKQKRDDLTIGNV